MLHSNGETPSLRLLLLLLLLPLPLLLLVLLSVAAVGSSAAALMLPRVSLIEGSLLLEMLLALLPFPGMKL